MKKLVKIIMALYTVFLCCCNGGYEEEQIENVTQISTHICSAITMPGKSYASDNIRNKIISLIEEQNKEVTLDVCIYGLDDELIISALESAITNGTHIRFIGNADGSKKLSDKSGYYYDGYRRIAEALDKYMPCLSGKRADWTKYCSFTDFNLLNNSGIMHNKFIIFTNSSGEKTLMTGSMNLTTSCIELNNNDIIFIKDNSLANKYTRHFEYLLGLKSSPEYFERFNIDGITVDAGFSQPSSKSNYITNRLTSELSECKCSADFMIFTATNKTFLNKLADIADSGLEVRGIFDRAQLYCSKEEILTRSNAECRYDGNENVVDSHGGKLHHKCIVLDADGENPTVITGSFNWTASADKQNNENILIIHSETIAGLYKSYFERIWDESKVIKK